MDESTEEEEGKEAEQQQVKSRGRTLVPLLVYSN